MRRRRAALAIALLACAPTARAADGGWEPLGPWRFAEGEPAPWARAAVAVDPALRGAALRFAAGRVEAPPPLGCDDASYEVRLQPAEGLFQGGLPAPAEAAARALGFASFPVATLRVTCSSGAFDHHFRDDATLLTALDDVVWRLARTGAADAPADVVQRLLLDHVTGDMGFTAARFARKAPWLTPALAEQGRAALAAATPPDEAPVIDGDPFTNSQEYPDRFALEASRVEGARAIVPVRFADDWSRRRVEFELERSDGAWRVADLRYEDGSTLRGLFQAAIEADPAAALAAFLARFRAALAGPDAEALADLTRLPFLFENEPRDRAGFVRIVPLLFDAPTRACLATARPAPEEDRFVLSCPPYAFYVGRGEGGALRLLEFGADGEDAP